MKKWIVCICMILFIISVAGVSASEDIDQTIQANTNENIDDIVLSSSNFDDADTLSVSVNESNDVVTATAEEDTLSASEWYVNASVEVDGNGTADSPYKSVDSLLKDENLADEDVVYVAPGTYSGTSNVNLTINNSLTFSNWVDGEVIFDAESLSRIFTINSADVTFWGITFKNGKSDNGAAIYANNATVIFTSCYFMDNEADSLGGAIYAEDSKVQAKGSLFVNNVAADGAVMAAYSENVTNYNSTFKECIILNNTSSNDNPTIFYTKKFEDIAYGTYNLNDNWWGNTADDAGNISEIKMCIPEGATLSEWLYLNISEIRPFPAGETVFIPYSLNNLYDENGPFYYFASSLPEITFDAVATSGDVLNVSELDNGMFIVTYLPAEPGKYNITVSYADVEYTNPVTVAAEDSFTALQYLIDKEPAVLNLTRDYKFYDEYDHVITILEELTINGNNHTIDGCNLSGIFEIEDADVVLNNIVFTNGNSIQGGAIGHDGGVLNINNCTFDSNVASEAGAAIFNERGTVYVRDSLFTSNFATYGGAFGSFAGADAYFNTCVFVENVAEEKGGALYFHGGTNIINNCAFVNNTATCGAAIYQEGDNTLSIVGSGFVLNNADNGTVIYATRGDIGVVSSLFAKNTATENACLVYLANDEGEVDISDSVILINEGTLAYSPNSARITLNYNWFGNNASNKNDKIVDEGDATLTQWLYIDADEYPDVLYENETYNATFSLNHYATADSTGYYSADLLPDINFNVTSTSAEILNVSDFENGAVDVTFKTTKPGIVDITFNYLNTTHTFNFVSIADDSFTALQLLIDQSTDGSINLECDYHYYNETDGPLVDGIVIDDSLIIYGNGFSIDGYCLARIFDVTKSVLVFNNVTLKNGNASGNGGAIRGVNSTFVFNICDFINNTASGNGGAIYADKLVGNNLTSLFINNTAGGNGGAIYADTIKECTVAGEFVGNEAKNGGAIYTNSLTESTFVGLFSDNTALDFGGVLYLESDMSDIIFNGTFINNSANYGGVAYVKGDSEGNTFVGDFFDNFANNGGVFYFYRQSKDDIFEGSFDGNVAGFGGAVANFRSSVTNDTFDGFYINNRLDTGAGQGAVFYFGDDIDDSSISGVFENNTNAKLGIIYIAGDSDSNTIIAEFSENVGNSLIYFNGTSNNNTVDGEFTGNNATLGGVIFFNNDATENTINGTFTGNKAAISGGVLYFNKLADYNTIDGIYSNNTATSGGVIYFNGKAGNNDIDAIFTDNTARYGGVIYFNGESDSNGIDGTYTDNNASASGGVVYFNKLASENTISGYYANNTAGNNGGVMYFNDEATGNSIDGDFTYNVAHSDGGVIFFSDASDNYITGDFTCNSASDDGAVFIFEGDAVNNTIQYATFEENIAVDGDIIAMNGQNDYTTIDSSVFLNNVVDEDYGVVFINNGDKNVVSRSIFAGNTDGYDIYSDNATVVSDCNWFGNNASNYNETPNVGDEVLIDNWLYLNATVEKEELDDYDVVFFLMKYENNVTEEYNNDLLPYIELDVTSSNGTLDEAVVSLNETVVYHPTGGSHATVTATLGDAVYAFEFDVEEKANVNLTVVADTITYGENATIALTYADNATGKVNVTIFGVQNNGTIYSFETQEELDDAYIIPDLKAGEYEITVLYLGDDTYWSSFVNTTLIVERADPILYINGSSEITPKDTQIIVVTTNDDIDGNFTVYINGELREDIIVVDGKINISDLDMGEYLIEVELSDDSNYNDAICNLTFNVVSCEYNLTVDYSDIIVGEDFIFNVTLPIDANGTITYIIGDENTTIDVNGTFIGDNVVVSVPVSDLEVGKYNLTVMYNGNKFYEASNTTVEFEVLRKYSPIDVANDDENVTIELPENATGTVNIVVNGEELDNFTLENGTAVVPIDNFKPGNYSLNITYDGDELYRPNSTVYNFTIERFEPEVNITVTDNVVTLELPSDATGTVNVTVNGEDYDVVDVINGTASVVIDKELGNYTVTMNYSGDDVYVGCETSTEIELAKLNSDINVTAYDINVTDIDELIASIYLPGDATGNVTITIGNETFTVEINESTVRGLNGVLVMPIINDNLSAGNYTISVTYNGNDVYYPSTASDDFEVFKLDLEYNITCVDNVYNITVPEDAEGNITLEIDNQTFVSPIVDGVASFDLNDLELGFYNGTLSYTGSDIYRGFEETIPFTVDGVVLNTTDLTKYFSSNEPLTVNVTDVNGKPLDNKTVIFNVDGKNYTRRTNENGSASMSLNTTTVGEHNVTITVDDVVANATVTIKTTIEADDIVKIFKNGTQFYATFVDSEGNLLENGTAVQFNINGVIYTRRTNENGTAKLNINLPQGEYIITSKNLQTGEEISNNITVLAKIVNNTDVVKFYRNATKYSVTAIDDEGNPVAGANVTFNINGVKYVRKTNDQGVASLNINLPAGNYTVTATYGGCSVSNNIKVLPVLSAENLTKKFDEVGVFVVNLVDGQGNPYPGQTIAFNINGVLYSRVTDANGQAGLTIRLPAGVYIITSSYNNSYISNTITVTE